MAALRYARTNAPVKVVKCEETELDTGRTVRVAVFIDSDEAGLDEFVLTDDNMASVLRLMAEGQVNDVFGCDYAVNFSGPMIIVD